MNKITITDALIEKRKWDQGYKYVQLAPNECMERINSQIYGPTSTHLLDRGLNYVPTDTGGGCTQSNPHPTRKLKHEKYLPKIGSVILSISKSTDSYRW